MPRTVYHRATICYGVFVFFSIWAWTIIGPWWSEQNLSYIIHTQWPLFTKPEIFCQATQWATCSACHNGGITSSDFLPGSSGINTWLFALFVCTLYDVLHNEENIFSPANKKKFVYANNAISSSEMVTTVCVHKLITLCSTYREWLSMRSKITLQFFLLGHNYHRVFIW